MRHCAFDIKHYEDYQVEEGEVVRCSTHLRDEKQSVLVGKHEEKRQFRRNSRKMKIILKWILYTHTHTVRERERERVCVCELDLCDLGSSPVMGS